MQIRDIFTVSKKKREIIRFICVCGGGGGGLVVNKLSSKFQRINRQIVSQDGQTGFLLISLICHLILINTTWIDPRGSNIYGIHV